MEEQFSFDPSPEAIAGFPEAVQNDVEGLLWLGYLEDDFSFCGHHFVIRTLRGDEELLAGLVTREYSETMAQAKAQVWSTIALALVAVDDDEDFCPPATRDKKVYARARFQYATSQWFWPIALFIYNRYSTLLERQAQAIKELEDLFSGSRISSTPLPGSLTDRASSEDEEAEAPQEDIRELLDPEEG